jgi:hypothetical protein
MSLSSRGDSKTSSAAKYETCKSGEAKPVGRVDIDDDKAAVVGFMHMRVKIYFPFFHHIQPVTTITDPNPFKCENVLQI